MSLSLSEFKINNVFISNNVVKYQINKEGIKFYNGAFYDIYSLPYIRYGLHFISKDDKLVIDKISDSTMKYIIIPNNSYYQQDNKHLELSLKPINDVTLNIEVEINRYYTTYNSEIQIRIDQWKANHSKILANIQRTKIELADINNRKSLIQNIITRLNNLKNYGKYRKRKV